MSMDWNLVFVEELVGVQREERGEQDRHYFLPCQKLAENMYGRNDVPAPVHPLVEVKGGEFEEKKAERAVCHARQESPQHVGHFYHERSYRDYNKGDHQPEERIFKQEDIRPYA